MKRTEIIEPETLSKELSGAQVVRVAELVSYQDNAVVNREIVKKPSAV